MYVVKLLLLSYLVVQCVNSQYVSFQQQPVTATNLCAGPTSTAMVEHFFNLIFSEFHNQPPVCVCVQMCPEHPTYCYPNGCFKKVEPKQIETTVTVKYSPTVQGQYAQVSQLQQDNTKPMSFLVDAQNHFMDNYLSFKSLDSKKASKYDDGNSGKSYKEMHRDPFKDRYQSIFKYKKSPKVHLRYNLREQVKHKKSDLIKIEKIDVSKAKWPSSLSDNKQIFSDKVKDNQYFHNLDGRPLLRTSKFFKRDVTRYKPKDNKNIDEAENNSEAAAFSLENLIENLIESSFGPLSNDTELDLNVNLDYGMLNNETIVEPITISDKRSLLNKNIRIILNETTNVVSINNTNENTDVNIYRDDGKQQDEMYKNVFNDMIASMSKNIQKITNSSIEMMEQFLGHRPEDDSTNTETTIDTTPEISVTEEYSSDVMTNTEVINVDNNILETTTKTSLETTALIKKMEREIEKEHINLTRKSHRRLLRKLHINKPN